VHEQRTLKRTHPETTNMTLKPGNVLFVLRPSTQLNRAARPLSVYTWFPWGSHMCLHERYFFMLVHSPQNVSCRNKGCGWSKYLWNKTGHFSEGNPNGNNVKNQ
jgi:hypothetical protein